MQTIRQQRWGSTARWLIGLGIGVVVTGVGVGVGAGGAVADPPGNNGTVKVVGEGNVDEIPDNEPHPTCVFKVQWYDFDKGANIVSTVGFKLQSPTNTPSHTISVDGPSQVFVGADKAGGAGNDFDGEATYTLKFTGLPQLLQGYHVKLTVHTPGSKGADRKSKVFWVFPCLLPPPPTESAPPTPTCPPTETPIGDAKLDDEPTCPTGTPSDTLPPSCATETVIPQALVDDEPTCPTGTPSETLPGTPSVTPSESLLEPTPSTTPTSTAPTVLGTESSEPDDPTGAPTAVDAGYGPDDGDGWSGLSRVLFVGGLAIAAAGVVLALASRQRGAHQA